MKKSILFFLLFLSVFSSAQEEFSFQLYFEDALGKKDTITLGYDPLATDSIDTAFNEINILNQPWNDSTFEVKITDKLLSILSNYPEQETFRTKKQIVKNYCLTTPWETKRIFVDIKNAIYPVTLSFDTLLHQNQCVTGSTIDIINPDIHIDPFEGPPIYFFDYIFHSSIDRQYVLTDRDSTRSEELKYKDTDGRYIYSFLITLKDNRWITLNNSNLTQRNLSVFPNPFSEKIEIQSDLLVSSVRITDLQGKEITFEQNGNIIYPKNCTSGIYFICFKANEIMYNYKIIKQ